MTLKDKIIALLVKERKRGKEIGCDLILKNKY